MAACSRGMHWAQRLGRRARPGAAALARHDARHRRWSTSLIPSTALQRDLLEDVHLIPPERIRNFCIIAHVDHGKSTLADRLIEMTGAISRKQAQAQLLDSLAVERSRGITIKAQTVSLLHVDKEDGETYLLNLIDTPGHVDFSYEVSRSIAACQGALLLVDATKGVQAQTVSNFFLAFEQDLAITPVVNKVDLGHADVEGTLMQMQTAFDVETEDAMCISAKTGVGCEGMLPALVRRMPPPAARREAPLRLLLFDSWYDEYRGVLCLVEVLDGVLRTGQQLASSATGSAYSVLQIELMRPLQPVTLPSLGPGHVGCVALGMRSIDEACVGDTLFAPSAPVPALPGFKKVLEAVPPHPALPTTRHAPRATPHLSDGRARPSQAVPMVFAGLFPLDEAGFEALQHAMDRFRLKDGSVYVEPTHSSSLGRGLRCGFLGMLHMEVVQQRLLEEHDCDVLVTAPTVPLRATLKDGTDLPVLSPESLPAANDLAELREPLVAVTILSPADYAGSLISLCEERGGAQLEHSYLGADRALLRYTMPLAEVATEFHDRVKTLSSGFASLDYEEAGSQPADVVQLSLRVNGKDVDALTRIVRRSKADGLARDMVTTLAAEMDRQVYEVVLQAVVGSRVLARETIRAVRKNVTAKCYGGDISRKKKLLQKQKDGKKRRGIYVGDVNIPQSAFIAVLSPNRRRRK